MSELKLIHVSWLGRQSPPPPPPPPPPHTHTHTHTHTNHTHTYFTKIHLIVKHCEMKCPSLFFSVARSFRNFTQGLGMLCAKLGLVMVMLCFNTIGQLRLWCYVGTEFREFFYSLKCISVDKSFCRIPQLQMTISAVFIGIQISMKYVHQGSICNKSLIPMA